MLTRAALQSASQHPCSVTGTPVAAYCEAKPRFSALLTGGIQFEPFHCLAATGNSLEVDSNLLVPAQTHVNDIAYILPL